MPSCSASAASRKPRSGTSARLSAGGLFSSGSASQPLQVAFEKAALLGPPQRVPPHLLPQHRQAQQPLQPVRLCGLPCGVRSTSGRDGPASPSPSPEAVGPGGCVRSGRPRGSPTARSAISGWVKTVRPAGPG